MEASYLIKTYPATRLPAAYRALIYSKWMRSLRHGNDYFKLVDSAAYYKAYGMYITSLLERLETTVMLAVLTDNEDTCLGFSVRGPRELHYVHVQKDQRGQGICKALIEGEFDSITHVTKCGLRLWNKALPNAKFNPFV